MLSPELLFLFSPLGFHVGPQKRLGSHIPSQKQAIHWFCMLCHWFEAARDTGQLSCPRPHHAPLILACEELANESSKLISSGWEGGKEPGLRIEVITPELTVFPACYAPMGNCFKSSGRITSPTTAMLESFPLERGRKRTSKRTRLNWLYRKCPYSQVSHPALCGRSQPAADRRLVSCAG